MHLEKNFVIACAGASPPSAAAGAAIKTFCIHKTDSTDNLGCTIGIFFLLPDFVNRNWTIMGCLSREDAEYVRSRGVISCTGQLGEGRRGREEGRVLSLISRAVRVTRTCL